MTLVGNISVKDIIEEGAREDDVEVGEGTLGTCKKEECVEEQKLYVMEAEIVGKKKDLFLLDVQV